MLLVALFLVLPFAELAVIVTTADAIGFGWTILLLVGLSVSGALLMRREGASVWRRLNSELAVGRLPTAALVDGTMVLFGGALLLTPGFLTDVAGLLLVLPPTRALLRPLVLRALTRGKPMSEGVGAFAFVRPDVVDARSTPADGSARPPGPASARVIDLTVHRPAGGDAPR
jgi:UPF0716 protein FxsA